MGWPQVVYIGLMALSIGITLALHGQPRTGKHNVGYAVIGAAISLGVVYWGGFFTA